MNQPDELTQHEHAYIRSSQVRARKTRLLDIAIAIGILLTGPNQKVRSCLQRHAFRQQFYRNFLAVLSPAGHLKAKEGADDRVRYLVQSFGLTVPHPQPGGAMAV